MTEREAAKAALAAWDAATSRQRELPADSCASMDPQYSRASGDFFHYAFRSEAHPHLDIPSRLRHLSSPANVARGF